MILATYFIGSVSYCIPGKVKNVSVYYVWNDRTDEKRTVDVGSIDNKNLWKHGNDWWASKIKYLIINEEQLA